MKKKTVKKVDIAKLKIHIERGQGVDLGILQTELANARKNAKASANALSRAEDANAAAKAALATAIEKLNAASRAVLAAG